jgi:hypothetical protein
MQRGKAENVPEGENFWAQNSAFFRKARTKTDFAVRLQDLNSGIQNSKPAATGVAAGLSKSPAGPEVLSAS